MADLPAGFHPADQALDELRRALRRTDIAHLDPGDLAAGLDDVEPDHLPGLQIDQRRVGELTAAADVGRAKADEAAGDSEHLERDPAARHDAVLGMHEQGVVEAGLAPEV